MVWDDGVHRDHRVRGAGCDRAHSYSCVLLHEEEEDPDAESQGLCKTRISSLNKRNFPPQARESELQLTGISDFDAGPPFVPHDDGFHHPPSSLDALLTELYKPEYPRFLTETVRVRCRLCDDW